ncbi:MAG: hypothetical protein NUV88_01910 [Candidatus Kaiserbacteria bacterium]|nr:hypothetical protein [Candidatus Kaiserbacteria bacterium]
MRKKEGVMDPRTKIRMQAAVVALMAVHCGQMTEEEARSEIEWMSLDPAELEIVRKAAEMMRNDPNTEHSISADYIDFVSKPAN